MARLDLRWILLGTLALFLAAGLASASKTDFVENARLELVDRQSADQYARAVAVSGGVLLTGARGRDDVADDAGAAYIYRRDSGGWPLEQSILPGDLGKDDQFGYAVAIEGDVACFGAPGPQFPPGSFPGAAYVYRFDGSTWVEEQKLVGDTGDTDAFGAAVALSGSTLLVGAWSDDGDGAVYVFDHDGSAWVQTQKLVPVGVPAGSRFGWAVAIDGTAAVVGATKDSDAGGSAGAAYFFRFDGSTWTQEQKVLPPSMPGSIQELGTAVALHSDRALVGAPERGLGNGTVYAYAYDGSAWTEELQLTASDADLDDRFGSAIALDGDVALIGAPQPSDPAKSGKAYTFSLVDADWTENRILTGSDSIPFDAFGEAIALDGDIALIGAPFVGGGGAAYAFVSSSCLAGSVNGLSGPIENVVFVNGSSGGGDRRTTVFAEGESFLVTVTRPSTLGNGRFVLHANIGEPAPLEQVALPAQLGTSCFPVLLSNGAAPVIVANSIGKADRVGESAFFGSPVADPDRADTILVYPGTVPVGTVLTFQGVLVDPGSASPKRASVTNGIVAAFE